MFSKLVLKTTHAQHDTQSHQINVLNLKLNIYPSYAQDSSELY